MLVLAGHEGCHVVERNCFHRSKFGRNGLFALCLPSLSEFLKIASMLTPVISYVGGWSYGGSQW